MSNLPIMILMVIIALACIGTSAFVAMHYISVASAQKSIGVMSSAAERLASLPPCDMNNLNDINKFLKEEFTSIPDSKLQESWQWYYTDTASLYSGDAAPSPQAYFSFDILVDNLKIKWDYMQASALVLFLSLFTLLVPPAIPLFSQEDDVLGSGAAIGIISMLVCLLFFLMATLNYRSRLQKLRRVFTSFVTALTSRLVSAEAPNNTSLILRSNKEAMASYKESVAFLTERMNTFILDEVTPKIADTFNDTISNYIGPALNTINYAISDNLRKMLISYEHSLQEMSGGFFDKLLAEGGAAINEIAKNIWEVNNALAKSGESYAVMLNASNEVMRQNFEACEKAYRSVMKVSDINSEVLSYLKESSRNAANITDSVRSLTKVTQENSALVSDISQRNDRLTSDVSSRLGGLSASMVQFIEKLDKSISQTSNMATETATALDGLFTKYVSGVTDGMDKVIESNAQTSDLLARSVLKIDNIGEEHFKESAKVASEIIGGISGEVSKMASKTAEAVEELFARYVLEMTKDVQLVMDNNSKTAEALAKSVIKIDEAGSTQFEKASKVAAEMITGISKEMREAMSGIGTDVATSIQSAYKENEKYIQSLTERTEKLVQEYDNYFSGINESTSNIITDMDFTVTNTLNRLSEEIMGIIEKFNESIAASAERYETNSKELIASFVEQTRDMGLYAHEINMDITTLSANLKESVGIFNDKMNQGISLTFTEFDKGVAEFTKRMTNTIEAIREAVDDLPMALSGKPKK